MPSSKVSQKNIVPQIIVADCLLLHIMPNGESDVEEEKPKTEERTKSNKKTKNAKPKDEPKTVSTRRKRKANEDESVEEEEKSSKKSRKKKEEDEKEEKKEPPKYLCIGFLHFLIFMHAGTATVTQCVNFAVPSCIKIKKRSL